MEQSNIAAQNKTKPNRVRYIDSGRALASFARTTCIKYRYKESILFLHYDWMKNQNW